MLLPWNVLSVEKPSIWMALVETCMNNTVAPMPRTVAPIGVPIIVVDDASDLGGAGHSGS